MFYIPICFTEVEKNVLENTIDNQWYSFLTLLSLNYTNMCPGADFSLWISGLVDDKTKLTSNLSRSDQKHFFLQWFSSNQLEGGPTSFQILSRFNPPAISVYYCDHFSKALDKGMVLDRSFLWTYIHETKMKKIFKK